MKTIGVILILMSISLNMLAQTSNERNTSIEKAKGSEQGGEGEKRLNTQPKGEEKVNKETQIENAGEVKPAARETEGTPAESPTIKSIAKAKRQPKPEKLNDNNKPDGIGQSRRPERIGRPGGANAPARRPMNVNRPASPGRR